jgi:hypothetical protein
MTHRERLVALRDEWQAQIALLQKHSFDNRYIQGKERGFELAIQDIAAILADWSEYPVDLDALALEIDTRLRDKDIYDATRKWRVAAVKEILERVL